MEVSLDLTGAQEQALTAAANRRYAASTTALGWTILVVGTLLNFSIMYCNRVLWGESCRHNAA
jgi:hypothetical protein